MSLTQLTQLHPKHTAVTPQTAQCTSQVITMNCSKTIKQRKEVCVCVCVYVSMYAHMHMCMSTGAVALMSVYPATEQGTVQHSALHLHCSHIPPAARAAQLHPGHHNPTYACPQH